MTTNTIKGVLQPLRNIVLVTNLESGERRAGSGVILLDDNMKDTGIRSRWAQVAQVGPDVTDVKPGDWILIKHGRWTYGFDVEAPSGEITKMWRVDYPEAVDVVSDEFPSELVPTNLLK